MAGFYVIWFPLVSIRFRICHFGLSSNMVANFILLFHVKENLKEVFNRALFLFRFPHFCLTLPLVFNESISGHVYVKDFSFLVPFPTLSCGLWISSITHNFLSLTRNMGIATAIDNRFYSISLSLFSLIFINEYLNQRAYLPKLINFLPDPYTIVRYSALRSLFQFKQILTNDRILV